jgi:1,4-alpha-glucan branching enzyme
MSLVKRYLKTKPICKVTFLVSPEAAGASRDIRLVGDFNQWDPQAHPMKRTRDGAFTTTVDLPAGSDFEFRYFMDEAAWENDWDADAYVPSHYGSDNSLVRT